MELLSHSSSPILAQRGCGDGISPSAFPAHRQCTLTGEWGQSQHSHMQLNPRTLMSGQSQGCFCLSTFPRVSSCSSLWGLVHTVPLLSSTTNPSQYFCFIPDPFLINHFINPQKWQELEVVGEHLALKMWFTANQQGWHIKSSLYVQSRSRCAEGPSPGHHCSSWCAQNRDPGFLEVRCQCIVISYYYVLLYSV